MSLKLNVKSEIPENTVWILCDRS